jgi:cell division GTPase FtsZ
MVFVTAAGGGTGTGAAPITPKPRGLGILTVGAHHSPFPASQRQVLYVSVMAELKRSSIRC